MKLFSIFFFLLLSNSLFAESKVIGIYKYAYQSDTINVGEEPVFLAVENQPEFPGGDNALAEFIASNVKYPPAAREYGIEGKVYVSFIIEKDGSVTNIKVLKGVGGSCDEEAKRVVSLLPNFIPGKQNGRLVRVQFNIPINFKLSNKQ